MLERTKAQSPFYTARRLRAIATGSELTGVAGSGTFRVHRIPSLSLRPPPSSGYQDFVRPHRPDKQAVHGGQSYRWAHGTDITASG
jgi:hypothetical protein